MRLRRLAATLLLATGGAFTMSMPLVAADLAALTRAEIVDLHRFLDDWSNARLEDTDSEYARFAAALAPDFVLIGADGSTAHRSEIVGALRGAHGRWLRDGLRGGRIEIRNVTVLAVSEPIAVATYEEWHLLAGRAPEGRVSTVLFRRDATAPGGVFWVHLHETGLPKTGTGPQ